MVEAQKRREGEVSVFVVGGLNIQEPEKDLPIISRKEDISSKPKTISSVEGKEVQGIWRLTYLTHGRRKEAFLIATEDSFYLFKDKKLYKADVFYTDDFEKYEEKGMVKGYSELTSLPEDKLYVFRIKLGEEVSNYKEKEVSLDSSGVQITVQEPKRERVALPEVSLPEISPIPALPIPEVKTSPISLERKFYFPEATLGGAFSPLKKKGENVLIYESYVSPILEVRLPEGYKIKGAVARVEEGNTVAKLTVRAVGPDNKFIRVNLGLGGYGDSYYLVPPKRMQYSLDWKEEGGKEYLVIELNPQP